MDKLEKSPSYKVWRVHRGARWKKRFLAVLVTITLLIVSLPSSGHATTDTPCPVGRAVSIYPKEDASWQELELWYQCQQSLRAFLKDNKPSPDDSRWAEFRTAVEQRVTPIARKWQRCMASDEALAEFWLKVYAEWTEKYFTYITPVLEAFEMLTKACSSLLVPPAQQEEQRKHFSASFIYAYSHFVGEKFRAMLRQEWRTVQARREQYEEVQCTVSQWSCAPYAPAVLVEMGELLAQLAQEDGRAYTALMWRSEGWTLQQIADELGMNRAAVRRVIANAQERVWPSGCRK